jgi:hypothetical protein
MTSQARYPATYQSGINTKSDPWTGAPGSPQRTWAENEMFRLLLASIGKAVVGFAPRFRPTYAKANVGHPSSPYRVVRAQTPPRINFA